MELQQSNSIICVPVRGLCYQNSQLLIVHWKTQDAYGSLVFVGTNKINNNGKFLHIILMTCVIVYLAWR